MAAFGSFEKFILEAGRWGANILNFSSCKAKGRQIKYYNYLVAHIIKALPSALSAQRKEHYILPVIDNQRNKGVAI